MLGSRPSEPRSGPRPVLFLSAPVWGPPSLHGKGSEGNRPGSRQGPSQALRSDGRPAALGSPRTAAASLLAARGSGGCGQEGEGGTVARGPLAVPEGAAPLGSEGPRAGASEAVIPRVSGTSLGRFQEGKAGSVAFALGWR